MQKGIYTLLIICFSAGTAFAQNRFSESENTDETFYEKPPEAYSGPGDDDSNGDLEGDDPLPTPIDDYLPLLGLAGTGIILLTHYRQRLHTK